MTDSDEQNERAESSGACSCCRCEGEPAERTPESGGSPTDRGAEGGGIGTSILGGVTGLLALVAVPKCPMCLTAYAGVLSAVGLGFLADAAVLTPLIGGLLVLQVGFVAWSARSHRNPWPVLATAAGALAVALARWVVPSDPLLYTGAAAIVGAAAGNFWLMQPRISKLRAKTG
ncbi:MAG: hypothetical protein ABEL76_02355 [Bradymonadaceae bacterium]